MREYSLPLREVFNRGLRRNENHIRNDVALVTCFNAAPSSKGLEKLREFPNYLPQLDGAWPFPQLFFLKGKTFVGTSTGLYEYFPNSDTYELRIQMHVVDPWAMLDFAPFYLCINESRMWAFNVELGVFEEVDYTKYPRCSAFTNFNGQLITGGDITFEGDVQKYRSRVAWSNIGSFDFTIGRKNVAGFTELDRGGAIRNILPLPNGFVVYSTRQIVMFTAVSSPVVTFSKRILLEKGVPYKGSVCKGRDEHIALTTDGTLYRITMEGVEEIGYEEFFDDFKVYKTVLTYNPLEEEYYLSNGLRTYVYRKEGLGELGQPITSGGLTYEGNFEVQTKPSINTDFIVVTDTFDMEVRGQKTLYAVEIASDSVKEMEMSIFWRSSAQESFRQTKWVRVGPTGIATLPTTGVEFRLALRVQDGGSVHLSGVNVRWKLTDKRAIRGQYVS